MCGHRTSDRQCSRVATLAHDICQNEQPSGSGWAATGSAYITRSAENPYLILLKAPVSRTSGIVIELSGNLLGSSALGFHDTMRLERAGDKNILAKGPHSTCS